MIGVTCQRILIPVLSVLLVILFSFSGDCQNSIGNPQDSLRLDSIGTHFLTRGGSAYDAGHFDLSRSLFEKAANAFNENGNACREAKAFYNIAYASYEMNDAESSVSSFIQAGRLFEKCGRLEEAGENLYNAGLLFHYQGFPDSSVYYLQTALLLVPERSPTFLDVLIVLHQNFLDLQNFEEAIGTLETGIRSASKSNNLLRVAEFQDFVAVDYLNFHVRDQYSEAIRLLQEAAKTYADSSAGNPVSALRIALANAMLSLGVAYEYTFQWEKAIDACRQSGEIFLDYFNHRKKQGNVDTDLLVRHYSSLFNVRNNMANAYAFLGAFNEGEDMQKEAGHYLEKLCRLSEELCSEKRLNYYTTEANLAAKQGRYAELEGHFRQLFQVLIPGYQDASSDFFPTWEMVQDIPEQDDVLEAMVDWCADWELSDLPPEEKYDQSIPMYELADRLVDKVMESQSSRDAVAFWRSTVMRLYQNAFEMSASRGDIETAFYYAEKSKAAGLLANILASRQGSVLDQAGRLKIKCRKQIDSLRLLLNTQGIAEPARDAIRGMLDSLQLKCNPIFFRKGQGVFQSLSDYIISPDSLKGYLEPDQAAIEYFDTELASYAIFINHDTVLLRKLADTGSRDSLIRNLISLVYEVSGSAMMNTEGTNEVLSALHRQLIQPFEGFIQNDRLIIVPAGPLFKVPFNALLRSEEGEESYLVETNPVQTAYSLSFLFESTKAHPDSDPGQVLAMAPAFDTREDGGTSPSTLMMRGSLAPLVFSEAEVEGISKQVRTKKVIGGSNLKEEFLRIAPEYQCLALSTHGKANDIDGMQSFVAFGSDSTEWLYAGEIYSKSIPAELLTLSACETAVGNYETGEGVISMSYAFRQAGVQSLVTTLWSVNDRTSAELMVSFYRGLAKGLTKDRALAEAQRNYLATTKKETLHPFFWAGFTLIGDASPLDLPRPSPIGRWWIAALFIIIPGLLYFLWRRRKRSPL